MWLYLRQKTLFLSTFLFVYSVSSYAENTSELLQRFRQAETDPAVAEALAQQGQERGQFCFRCHGEDGNSRRDYVPNLASQNAAYLFTQFEKFANGERENFVMSKLAGSLTADERVAIAVYFSDKPVLVRENRPAPDLKGQQIYQSLCFACHGNAGHGNEIYPRIAGQPYEFLEKTLLKFRAGDASRANSPMTAVVSNMKEEDLKAVASWVANMP
ncbi:MAG: c-type cytochrome [Thalassolituus sp.]